MKDWVKQDERKNNGIRGIRNPGGADRKNRLKRDFESDISIVKDQARNRFKERQWSDDNGSFDPHDYL